MKPNRTGPHRTEPNLTADRHRFCYINIRQILIPQQESIKASRGRGSGGGMLNGFLDRKTPSSGPHFSIVIVRAKVRTPGTPVHLVLGLRWYTQHGRRTSALCFF